MPDRLVRSSRQLTLLFVLPLGEFSSTPKRLRQGSSLLLHRALSNGKLFLASNGAIKPPRRSKGTSRRRIGRRNVKNSAANESKMPRAIKPTRRILRTYQFSSRQSLRFTPNVSCDELQIANTKPPTCRMAQALGSPLHPLS